MPFPFSNQDDEEDAVARYKNMGSVQTSNPLDSMGDDGQNYQKMLVDQLNAPAPEQQGFSDNAFLAALSNSAAKLGTIGGKSAESDSVQRYADILDRNKQAQQQNAQAQMAKRQDILYKLASLKDASANKQMDIAQSKTGKDTEFQREKELLGMRLAGERQMSKDKNLMAQQTTQQKQVAKPTVAQQAVDRNFARDYNDYIAQGGFAEAEKGLSKVRNVADQLRKDQSLTGAMSGLTPDWVKSFTNPKAIDVRDNLEDVVQRGMRQIMGAQFTEAEGKRLLARAYNPSLPASVNAERVEKLADSMEQMAKAKSAAAHYYETNGTLAGFQGATANSIDEMLADIDKIKPKGDNDVMAAEPPKGPAKPAASTGPKPGDIVKGYQFSGGDPSDKNNWVKVK